MSRTLDLPTRRTLLTAFRYACPDSPASCARMLTEFAIKQGLVRDRPPIPGDTLRSWAVDGKPPLWAALAAGRWLIENDCGSDRPSDRDALDAMRDFSR